MHQVRGSFRSRAIDFLVTQCKTLAGIAILITALLAVFVPGMKGGPTLKSAVDKGSEAYREYRSFSKLFGNEEFMLVAISTPRSAEDPDVLRALGSITKEIAGVDHVKEVISLTTLKMFMDKKGLFGLFPLVTTEAGKPTLIEANRLEKQRKALPLIDFLVSRDMKTVGVLVRVDEQFRFDVPVIEGLLSKFRTMLDKNLPPGSQYRIVGPHVIRVAIQEYNVQTALIFGVLCLLISTAVSVYIFKSLRVAFTTFAVVGASVIWILAFMSITGIPLNSTTGLSFGLVLIVSVATVIRIVTHFNEKYALVQDKTEACRQALQVVLVPCLMCSATTAVGFGTIMVSTIPMVFQLGLIMSLGVMVSFGLAVALTPALLIVLRPLKLRAYERMSSDRVTLTLAWTERIIFHHYRVVVAAGIVFTLAMLSAVPFVRSDTQILRMLSDSTREVKDLNFVEQHLAPVNSIELVIEPSEGTFKNAELWKRVAKLDRELKTVPEIVGTQSLLSLLEYMSAELRGHGTKQHNLFADPKVIPELLGLMGFSSEGRQIMRRHLDPNLNKMRVSVQIKNSPSVPISETIEAVRSKAAHVMNGKAKVVVTGEIAVFAAQAEKLVKSQLLSLVLAFFTITVLMMIQLGSPVLGLISLIPNIPPVAAIFGVMGWSGISLDTVTVFAATVALGLAVDDTIHYLAQLKQEMKYGRADGSIEGCIRNAHEITARAMLSTSAVLFFGFAVLVISPFRPVVSFGILGSTAILVANLGDMIFLPSVILASATIRGFISRKMAVH